METPGRIRRLADELDEIDAEILKLAPAPDAFLEELDYALRPAVHERRIPSFGAFVAPAEPLDAWSDAAGFGVASRRTDTLRDATVRRFADGLASWVVRSESGIDDLVVFDRTVGSERDLTVMAEAAKATIVQRHPNGMVKAVGEFGVLRFDGITWHVEPPLTVWFDVDECVRNGFGVKVVKAMLMFAIHDVAARGIGAIFIIRPDGTALPSAERRFGTPPPFEITRAADLAPLHHILGQIDGAVVFDEAGVLRELGIRLVPSTEAEDAVDAFRGTRHTSALRYSFDDPAATVIVVSEDGPVSLLQGGRRLGLSE